MSMRCFTQLKNTVLPAAFGLILAVGCRPVPSSNVESLEAFISPGHGADLPQCLGNGPTYPGIKPSSPLVNSLGAVPLAVQYDFFHDYRGRVELVDSVDQSCKAEGQNVSQYNRNSIYRGCYKIENDPTGDRRIVMYAEKANFQQNLVRLFGVFAAEMVVSRSIPNNVKSEVQFNEGQYQQWNLSGLAANFIKDIVRRDPANGAALLEQSFQFSKPMQAALFSKKLGPVETVRAYNTYRGSDKYEFELRIFEEAFDSWYCSIETRTRGFETMFPDTFQIFKHIAEDIDRQSARLGAARTASAPDEKLTLADGKNASAFTPGFYDLNARKIHQRRASHADLGYAAVQASGGMGLAPMNLPQLLLNGIRMLFGGLFGGPAAAANPRPANPLQRGGTTDKVLGGAAANRIGIGSGGGDFSTATLAGTNKIRAQAGVAALQHDPALDQGCKTQTDAMARQGNRLEHCLVSCDGAAENIAIGTADPSAAVNMWFNSSGHRANMENGAYRTYGAAATGTSTCQRFGR